MPEPDYREFGAKVAGALDVYLARTTTRSAEDLLVGLQDIAVGCGIKFGEDQEPSLCDGSFICDARKHEPEWTL